MTPNASQLNDLRFVWVWLKGLLKRAVKNGKGVRRNVNSKDYAGIKK